MFNKIFHFQQNDEFSSHLGIYILLLISTKVLLNLNYEFSSQWSILIQIQIFNTELNSHTDEFTPDRGSLITIMNFIAMIYFCNDEITNIYHKYKFSSIDEFFLPWWIFIILFILITIKNNYQLIKFLLND